MSKYDTLNPMQREAVFHTEGPLLVLAGAGSGKTRVLTHRIAYLIEEKRVAPWNIMAITFTNKAAAEMRERVDKIVGEGAEAIWVSTFHSSCVRILRRFIDRLGYDTNFTIYDGDDQKTLMKQVLKKMQADPKQFKERAVLSRISAAKNDRITADEFEQQAGADFREKKIAQIYREYQKELKKNNALDFDDLLVKTVELFEANADVLEYYQDKFRYIMVDEYQDTNLVQFKLVDLLAKKYRNICVVGDDDQSIYKFRGANIENILSFEKAFPGARVIKLEQNYRSTQSILNAANEVIRHNRGRKDKTLWTANDEGPKVRFRQYDTAYEEADAIIRDIEREKEEKNAEYSDFAVLYRTNAQSRLLEEKCIYYSIPYRLVGGVNFYQRKEIKDILCYLKTIANGRDDLAVQRVINVPKRGIGATSIGKVTIYASANGMSFYDALLRVRGVPTIGKAADKIEKFTEQIENFRSRLSVLSIPELIEAILEETGYKKDLEAEGEIEGETRLQNVEELVNKATGYMSTAEEPTLDGFLEEVALVADVDSLDESENRIVLMTLHGAKGLEFPYVYLSGMEDGLFPSSMSIFSDDKDAIEEERRLCYVGITRAEKELTLTAARQRMVNGETRFAKVSRFIEEIPPQLLDEEEQPTVFERTAGMSRGRRGFEDSGTSGWTTGSFGVSGAGDGDRVRIGGMSGKHPLSENDAVWERGAARMSGWGGVNGSGSAGSSRTLDP
ncbi:UvrD-helicase domain-containing protein, partial [Clostridium sp.]